MRAPEPGLGAGLEDVSDDETAGLPVDGPETVAEKRLLATVGRQARVVNLRRVEQLVALLDHADAGTLDEERWREAENVAHQLIGSAGTFGRAAASDDAMTVEDYFTARHARRALVPSSASVRATLERLRQEFADPQG